VILKPLKRVAVPEAGSAELVEPSAGLASAFVMKLKDFPKIDEDRVAGNYFSGLRILICLYDNGAPFLPQLVNSLHDAQPELWPVSVQEGVPVRQTLDDLDVPYLVRIVEYFLDALNVNQMESFSAIIRTEIWTDKESTKKA
jgi:hypothetical protein